MIKKISFIISCLLIGIAVLIGLDGDDFTRMSAIGFYLIGGIGCALVVLYHLKTKQNETL